MPSFLEPDELDIMRADIERLLAAPLVPGCERPHNTLVPLRWNDGIVAAVLSSPRRMDVLADRVGADDLRWVSGYLSLKEPGTGALSWHQDWWCWDHQVTYRREAPQVALLVYLEETDTDNGALRLIPGSHLRSIPLHAALPEAHGQDAGRFDDGHPSMRDDPDQVTLAASPGDAAVLDYRLLHGTHPNNSASRRDCILLTFAPGWRRLPTEIRAHLIRHPAQPAGSEQPAPRGWPARLLPEFDGPPRDLPLNRSAPAQFSVRD
jgi:hypothetical protein